ncbi:unannotated protein [freshwater metagenome]|uniref:Unannotated protein n=1 Tax=freshwater metagenome TaxID=449393 RepID=A0A6J7SRD6_9ZZZZ
MLAASLGVGKNNAVDELLEAPLAVFCANSAAEVFGGDDR